MKRLNAALAYARKGIHVFPLAANSKEPMDGWKWKEIATTDERVIKSWWGRHPDWNIGVAAEPSGLVIVDVDNKGEKKGSDVLEQLRGDAPPVATLTVKTPSGGFHYYFIGDPVQSGTNKLGQGVDVKSGGGYVVGIGSEINGVPYAPVSEPGAGLAVVPEWIKPGLTKFVPRDPDASKAIVELDQPLAVEAATKHLESEPGAVQGAGGDAHTFRVAARLLDFGLSMGVAHRLLSEHWNAKCSPPWSEEDLLRKVRNAWSYRREPVGVDSPDSAFEGLEIEKDPPMITPLTWPEEALLPRRRWLLGRSLLRGKISQLVADGGTGKSTFALQMAVAVAARRGDIVDQEVIEQTGVLVINNEDDLAEMYRRLYGVMAFFKVKREDLKNLYLYSGVDRAFLMVSRDNHNRLKPVRFNELKAEIMSHGIGYVIVDPLVEVHEAEENDNREMGFVMRTFRQLASECDIAVQIIHHTSKPPAASPAGYAGNMHRSRGASAVGGVARVVQTLYEMSEKEGEEYGIEDYFQFVRMDDAKANLSAKRKDPRWFKKEPHILDNGDEVAVLKPVRLTPSSVSETNNVLDLLGDFDTTEVAAAAGKLTGPEYGSPAQCADLIKRMFAKPVVRDGWIYRLATERRGNKNVALLTRSAAG